MANVKMFRVVCTYKGFSIEMDEKLFSAAKKALNKRHGYSDGSGCGLGERDHEWNDLNLLQATTLVTALSAISPLLDVYYDDEEN